MLVLMRFCIASICGRAKMESRPPARDQAFSRYPVRNIAQATSAAASVVTEHTASPSQGELSDTPSTPKRTPSIR